MSYTTFDVEPRPLRLAPDHSVELSVAVMNTGAVAGREVVQLYVSKPNDVVETPAIELVDFAKTRLLDPSDHEVLGFTVPLAALVHVAALQVRRGRSDDHRNDGAQSKPGWRLTVTKSFTP